MNTNWNKFARGGGVEETKPECYTKKRNDGSNYTTCLEGQKKEKPKKKKLVIKPKIPTINITEAPKKKRLVIKEIDKPTPYKPTVKKLKIGKEPVEPKPVEPKPFEPKKLVIAEPDTKKAIKIRKEMKEIKNLIPKSKYKSDLEDAGAGAGAGSSATYDKDELEKDLQKLQRKLMLADNNIKVGNIVADGRWAMKITKLTPSYITYEIIGQQGWEGDYYTVKRQRGEVRDHLQDFLIYTLEIGVNKYINYK